ncbi:MAG TPA: hypothetical protein VIU16_05060 [Gaiellaceae bacterium]
MAGVEAPQARRAWAAALREWLGNPLIVAVVTILLGSVVVPHLTRGWQDHQKALEIQSGLVGSMSQTASDAVISARLLASHGPTSAAQGALERSTRSWAVESSVIASKLRAYFPGSELGDRWSAYADGVTDYLQLYASVDRYRPLVVAQIRALGLPATNPRVDWGVLTARNSGPAFVQSYTLLGFALLDRRDELVRDVLAAHPAGY